MDGKMTIEDRYNDPNRIPITVASQRLSGIIKEVIATNQRKLITKGVIAIAAICPLSEVAIFDDLKCRPAKA